MASFFSRMENYLAHKFYSRICPDMGRYGCQGLYCIAQIYHRYKFFHILWGKISSYCVPTNKSYQGLIAPNNR